MQPPLAITPSSRLLASVIFAAVAAFYILIVLLSLGAQIGDELIVVVTLIAGFIVMYLFAPKIARSATKGRSHLKVLGAGLLVTIATYALAAMLSAMLEIARHYQFDEGDTVIDAVLSTLYVTLGAPFFGHLFFGYLQLLMALPVGAMTVWLIYAYARRNAKTAA